MLTSKSNGRTAGITHPSREGQRAAIQSAYRRAGNLNPLDTAYVECHGTGTPVGDPLEVQAVADVFCKGRPADTPLLIGSVCKFVFSYSGREETLTFSRLKPI